MFNFYSNFGRPANKAAGMESRDGDLGLDEFSRYDAMADIYLLLCALIYLYLCTIFQRHIILDVKFYYTAGNASLANHPPGCTLQGQKQLL